MSEPTGRSTTPEAIRALRSSPHVCYDKTAKRPRNRAFPTPSSMRRMLRRQLGDDDDTHGSSCAASALTPVPAIPVRPRVEPPVLCASKLKRYIGVLTPHEAERFIQRRTDFRLYHQWLSAERLHYNDILPLAMVYHSSRGTMFHWLVRSTGHVREDRRRRKHYEIDFYFIEESGPTFKSLEDMIECYENVQYLEYGEVDVFRCAHLEGIDKSQKSTE